MGHIFPMNYCSLSNSIIKKNILKQFRPECEVIIRNKIELVVLTNINTSWPLYSGKKIP